MDQFFLRERKVKIAFARTTGEVSKNPMIHRLSERWQTSNKCDKNGTSVIMRNITTLDMRTAVDTISFLKSNSFCKSPSNAFAT